MSTTLRWLMGLMLLTVLGLGGLGLLRTGLYGLTIFILFPILLGGLGAWLCRPVSAARAIAAGTLTVIIAVCSLLFFGLEGLGCIVMALPLAAPLGAAGGWFVYLAASSRAASRGGALMLLLLPPSCLTWDTQAQPAVFEVRSAVTIAAPPERVWKHVLTFSELPEPREWYFRSGIAYPVRARIQGTGVGAIRFCEFSTGPFVEPIEVWNEPYLLRFRVIANPAPMREWSPYGQILPKHLHGYLVSKHGQFRLTELPGGRTLLEGMTWYQHGLWPSDYWRWWSDAIIHRIHLRVLNHIRMLAENEGPD